MRSIAVLISVLVLLGLSVTAYVLTRSDAGGEVDSGNGSVERFDPETGARTMTELLIDTPIDQDGERVASGTTEDVGARQELLIEVVEREGGKPVPRARLQFVDWTLLGEDEMANAMQAGSDPQKVLERYAVESFTDGDGKATLLWSGGEAVLIGSKDGMRGLLPIVRQPDGPLRLALSADKPVFVEVVDPSGRLLAGVPVGIAERVGGARFRWDLNGETDESGRWEPPYIAQRFLNAEQLFAGLNIPQRERVTVSFPFAPPPTEPVRIELSATGEVVVDVRGPDGRPVKDGAVSICATSGDERMLDFEARVRGLTAEVVDGVARFPYVGVGVDLFFLYRSDEGAEVKYTAAGPVARGETVRVRLDVTRQPTLIGRLIDENGKALAGKKYKCSFMSMGGRHGISRALDAEGRFRVVVPERFRDSTLEKSVLFEVDDLQAELDLPAVLAADEIDLGTIVLGIGSLLASGRVVDAAGDPVAGAAVHIQKVFHRDRDSGAVMYVQIGDLATESDIEGRFEIRGPIPEEPDLALSAVKFGYDQGDPVPMGVGASDVVLTLDQSGAVVGSIVLLEGMEPRSVHCALSELAEIPTERKRYDRTWTGTVDSAGEVAWLSVPAGTYTFRLQSSIRDSDLLTVEGVIVRAGETTRDPRMQKIDIATLMNRVTIEVVGEKDQPVLKPVVWVKKPGSNGMTGVHSKDGRFFECVAPLGERLDVIVRATGFRSVELSSVTTDQKVVMRRGIVALVRLLGDTPIVDDTRRLTVMFRQVGDGASNRVRPAQAFDGARQLRLSFPGPGTYRVLWGVTGGRSASQGFLQLGTSDGGTIEITDDIGEQVIELTPDADWAEVARKQLGQ